MTYQETLNYLFSALAMYQRVGSKAYKADLSNAHLLDEHFQYPHQKYKTIHIAGTNGKGSVSHMLSAVLQKNGYKTGLYTSPHLLDFRERIKVNGIPVSKEFVVEFTEKHRPIFEKIQPSFFEMTVFMAFEYFKQEKVDIAVVEVGLGGRLDTTNIITPVVSVITNIGLDHTQILGDTLPKIALEKAGIIKSTVPVVIGETHIETEAVFTTIANNLNSKIIFADRQLTIDRKTDASTEFVHYHLSKSFYWDISEIALDLKGRYQQKNLVTTLMTLSIIDQCGIKLEPNSIISAFRQVKSLTDFQGRWIEVGDHPLIVCDTAHNVEGLKEVIGQLHNLPHKHLHMVLGFVSDKNLTAILEILPRYASFYLCEPDIPRAKKVRDLAHEFSAKGFSFDIHVKVSEAFIAAKIKAHPEDCIYVGGSTFIVADFLRWKKTKKAF